MLGTHDKTLCGWSVTTGELTQLKKMDSKYVNCKRFLEKLDAANQPSSNLKNKRAIPPIIGIKPINKKNTDLFVS